MNELDNRGRVMVLVALIATGARGRKHHQWAQAFAAAADDIARHLVDQRDIAGKAPSYQAINSRHIATHQVAYLIEFHKVFEYQRRPNATAKAALSASLLWPDRRPAVALAKPSTND
jgi:hypothetical protein